MEYLYGFLAVILAVVVLRLLNAHWQRKQWRTRPPMHRARRNHNEAGSTRTRRPRTTTPTRTAVGPRRQ